MLLDTILAEEYENFPECQIVFFKLWDRLAECIPETHEGYTILQDGRVV